MLPDHPRKQLYGIPEIWVLKICQILKSVRIDVQDVTVRSRLRRNLPLVPPDQNEPHGQSCSDETAVNSDMNVERVEVPWSPFRLEELRSDGITGCPSDEEHGVDDRFLGLTSDVSGQHGEHGW